MTASDNDLIRRGDAIDAMCKGPRTVQERIDAIRAIPAVQVTVKPLEWCENPDAGERGFLGGGVTNSIYHAMPDGWAFHRSVFWHDAPNIEAAKAAAQADYDARIRSALTVQPLPDVAALVEALEWYISEDDTNDGDEPMPDYGKRSWNEINAYWIEGKRKAIAALARVKWGEA